MNKENKRRIGSMSDSDESEESDLSSISATK